MKQITAFIHHVRSADVIDALRDAGYKNLSLLDIKGTLKPLGEQELAYSSEAGVVISEVQLSLVCDDNQVDEVTTIIRKTGKIGSNISGWVYVTLSSKRYRLEEKKINFMANSNPTNTFCGWLCLSGLILLMDQASKYAVERTIEYGERVEINSILNIVHMMNPGAAFSLLADAGGWQRYFFIALASGVSVWLVWTMRRRPTRLEAASYSMLLGGALGNLVDRVWRGSVVDFLDFHWSYSHWPAFNLADTAIFIGVCIFIVSTIGSRNHQVHDEGDNSDHENNKGMR